MDPSDFVDVTTPSPEQLAAEGALTRDSLLTEADSPEAKVATAERYGSSHPEPVSDSQHAQLLQERTAAETEAAELAGFKIPAGAPDFLTPQPERLGNAEDRQRTRLRLDAMNQPRELGGLGPYGLGDSAPPGAEIGGSLGVEFTDVELDAYAQAGRDPVAEMAAEVRDRSQRAAAQAISVAQREAEIQRGVADRRAQQQAAYDREEQNAIQAARARGAHESLIRFHLSMGTLPGHPGRRP